MASKEYYQKYKERTRKQQQEYYQKTKEERKKCVRKYYEKNNDTPEFKEKRSIRGKKYRSKEKEKIRKYNKIYSKKHPEIKLKSTRKCLEKIANELGMRTYQFSYALKKWTKNVQNIQGSYCAVCFSFSEIETHHLFEKAKYPLLALNINNGIVLCKECHVELQ
tara:strand:- start:3278 stop:3769 length:492 start_codon:yes stop_codon:yes gene_type:complete